MRMAITATADSAQGHFYGTFVSPKWPAIALCNDLQSHASTICNWVISFVVMGQRLELRIILISASEKPEPDGKISSRRRVVKLAAVLAAKKPTTTEAIKPANDIKSTASLVALVFQAKYPTP